MGVREFSDDDAGYLTWLDTNPDRYVMNIARSHRAADARVHLAGCWTISGRQGGRWTGPYVKICADQVTEIDEWASDRLGMSIPRCKICSPALHTTHAIFTKRTKRPVRGVLPEGRCTVYGPDEHESGTLIEAWADDYIRFERRPDWQEHLRSEIRARCRLLEPGAGQLLHATFFGPKLPNADVENLVLYYIDTFKVAGRNGIRFEYDDAVPSAPDGGKYPFCYRYALSPVGRVRRLATAAHPCLVRLD